MASCASCNSPLVLRVEIDSEEPSATSSSQSTTQDVPDDVELSCGCHFHWQCILDAYEVTQCPKCSLDISSSGSANELQILCTLRNEGGVQENLDIFPILSEELYLKAYPDDRKPRAFLEFCKEGDIEAIVDLLKASDESYSEDDDDEEEEEEDMNMDDEDEPTNTPDAATVLRYQDPIGDMQSALHIAVRNSNPEIIWLLLLLGSSLDEQHFPPQVMQAAGRFGISRESQDGHADIRSLKDANGKVAAQYVSRDLSVSVDLLTV